MEHFEIYISCIMLNACGQIKKLKQPQQLTEEQIVALIENRMSKNFNLPDKHEKVFNFYCKRRICLFN
jgi:hypothetical protein